MDDNLINEKLGKTIVEAMKDYVVLLDRDLKVQYVNRLAPGIRQEDVIGAPLYTLANEESQQYTKECLETVIAHEKNITYETLYTRPDGSTVIFENIASPTRRSGKILGVTVIARDITKRKQTENALIEGEKKYRELIEALNEGIWEIDKESDTTFVNSRMAQMLGYSSEEMIGKNLFNFMDEQGKAICEENLERRKQGVSEQHEFEFLRKDGSRIITLMEGSPVFDADGNFAGGIAGVIDITERKLAEEKIKKNEEYIRNILDTVDDGFIVVDRDYRIITANKAYCDQVSLPGDKVEGRHCYEVWHHTERPCFEEGVECIVRKTFATGKSHTAVHKRVTKDGEVVFLETKAFPSMNESGNVASAIETTRNITEKYLLEAEQLKTQKLEAIGTLAGGIAHDFNNLLQGVFGYVSLAKMAVNRPEEVSQLLDQVENALALSVNLTNQLLTFAKGGKPVIKTTDLRPIIENASKFALSGSRCNYRLTMPDTLSHVDVDEGQITQIIHNIILNASEAMPEGGNIDISAANVDIPKESSALLPDGGRFIKVMISDAGIGIPKKHLSKVFDPYFTTKHKGSGLGLATSYSIVRNHGGAIEVLSEPEIGTAFHVYLQATEIEKELPVHIHEKRTLRKCRVLVMDDEDRVIDIAEKMITVLGHDVEHAKDGEGAIEKYRQALAAGKPFDIVILDLTIKGGMGGEEAIKRLLEIDPNVKAIVSSGYSDNSVLANFQDYGFSAVLGKPYTLADMRKCLNALVG
jgi:PAS domain S-box-containing protein